MLTYLNGHAQKTEQTDAEIVKTFEEVDEIMTGLNDDEFDDAVEIISRYIFDDDENAVKEIEKYGFNIDAGVLWYSHDKED